MNIFNSLGSNYDWQFILNEFSTGNNPKYPKELKAYLEQKYQGQAILTYKGREALKLAFERLNLAEGNSVAINGYTCFAVFEAAAEAGLKVKYLDISPSSLNFSAETLRLALQKNPMIRVVVIQNTLGEPCEIEAIGQICQEKNLILIEDLAHSVGTRYKNGQEAGTVGDFVILSFSQDKMIDAISGGALIIRNQQYQNITPAKKSFAPFSEQFLDLIYPVLTFIIRKTYIIGFGKFLHFLARKMQLLSTPMGAKRWIEIHDLPAWYCGITLKRFEQLDENLKHRREIALTYAQTLNQSTTNIQNSSCLRYPLRVKDRANLIAYLKSCGVYVSDIWYDAPIAPKSYASLVDYSHDCLQAEKVSEMMLNLPTHKNVTVAEAKLIASKINQWLSK